MNERTIECLSGVEVVARATKSYEKLQQSKNRASLGQGSEDWA